MENGQIKKVPVIYSLGNLISNMSAKNTRIGLMAGFKFVRKTSGDIEISEPEFEFTWCTLPGRKYGSHATVPVRRNIDKKADWKWEYDFELMVQTYDNVMKETGIYEKNN
jgi:poly-gamma-glutamate synthesis protein (capsule biosynthesis protein)